MAAGGTRARSAVTAGWPAGCPGAVSILSDALARAGATRDTAYLFGLAVQTLQVRDIALIDAAARLTSDRRSTEASRAAGILVMVGQLGGGWEYPDVHRAALLTEPISHAGVCAGGIGGFGGLVVDHTLPDDAPRRVAQVLDAITLNENEASVLLRNLARCSRPVISGVPLQINLNQVGIRYVCGNTFRVHNHTGESVVLSYSVAGSDEHGGLNVREHSHRGFTPLTDGAVRLSYDGHVIATVPNTHRVCKADDDDDDP